MLIMVSDELLIQPRIGNIFDGDINNSQIKGADTA